MANVLSPEAYLPCLMDRLADDQPETVRESHYRQTLTISHFRKCVLRDLGWLLNSPSHLDSDGLEDFPEVEDSVLNYGTADLTGRTASSVDMTDLEAELVRTIKTYEPRILPKSLSVKVVPGVNKSTPNTLGFEIRGLMWANPMPEQFFLETQIDLETGQCEL